MRLVLHSDQPDVSPRAFEHNGVALTQVLQPVSAHTSALQQLSLILGPDVIAKAGSPDFDRALLEAMAKDYDHRATVWEHAHAVVSNPDRFFRQAFLHNFIPDYYQPEARNGMEALVDRCKRMPEFAINLLESNNEEYIFQAGRLFQLVPEHLQSLVDYVGKELNNRKVNWPIQIFKYFGEAGRPYRSKLLRFLKSKDPRHKEQAADACKALGDLKTRELKALFECACSARTHSAIECIAGLMNSHRDVRAFIFKKLTSFDPQARRAACEIFEACGRVNEAELIFITTLIYKDKDPRVINAAMNFAAACGVLHKHFDAVLSRLEHEDPRSTSLRSLVSGQCRFVREMVHVIDRQLKNTLQPEKIALLLSLLYPASFINAEDELVLTKAAIGLRYLSHPDSAVYTQALTVLERSSQYLVVKSLLSDQQKNLVVAQLPRAINLKDRELALNVCTALRLYSEEVINLIHLSLQSSDSSIRFNAVNLVNHLGCQDEKLLPWLLVEAKREHSSLALDALVWFGQKGTGAIEMFLADCKNQDLKKKARLLAKPHLMHAAIAGIDHTEHNIAFAMLVKLARIGKEPLRLQLAKIYKCPTDASNLPSLSDLVAKLRDDLSDKTLPPYAWHDVAALAYYIGPEAAIFAPEIVKWGLAQNCDAARRMFVLAIGNLGPAALPYLHFVKCELNSEDFDLRATALKAYQKLTNTYPLVAESHVEKIETMLEDRFAWRIPEALTLAGYLENSQLALLSRPLLTIIKRCYPEISAQALGLYSRIISEDAGHANELMDFLSSSSRTELPEQMEIEVGKLFAEHYKLLHPSPALIQKGLKSESPQVQILYMDLIAKECPYPCYFPELIEALNAPNLLDSALWTLFSIGNLPEEICSKIQPLTEHPQESTRFEATRALSTATAQATRHGAASAMTVYLQHGSPWQQMNALSALSKARSIPQEMLECLLPLLLHSQRDVRYHAAKALAHFKSQLSGHKTRLVHLASNEKDSSVRNQLIWLANNAGSDREET